MLDTVRSEEDSDARRQQVRACCDTVIRWVRMRIEYKCAPGNCLANASDEVPSRWLSGLRDLKNSLTLALPAVSSLLTAMQFQFSSRRMTYDTQKYLGETYCSSHAEFAFDAAKTQKPCK